MSSYVFINSMSRNVYEYPNSADFIIDHTENWNLIRSVGPSLPIQRSQNQYYNVKVCSLQLPAIPEILNLPGVFLSINIDEINKIKSSINHIPIICESGFPCDALVSPTGGPILTTDEINDMNIFIKQNECVPTGCGPSDDQILQLKIKKKRAEESNRFYENAKLNDTNFFMICDKVQFNGEGEPKWVQYKSFMDQVLPLNLRGNDVHFRISDPYGKTIILNQRQDPDPWYPCGDTSPTNPCKQVFAVLEFTYLPCNEKALL